MKDKRILVTGASIAGPTLSYWLNGYGFNVTIAERAAELRLGGQNIDVKGPAREIARKMGIEETIREKASTDSHWARWCNAEKGIVFLIRPDKKVSDSF